MRELYVVAMNASLLTFTVTRTRLIRAGKLYLLATMSRLDVRALLRPQDSRPVVPSGTHNRAGSLMIGRGHQ